MGQSKSLQLMKRILSITFTVVTVILGVLFVVQALTIYNAGKNTTEMYTREIVGSKLAELALPIILWIVLAITTFVIGIIAPQELHKKKNIDVTKVLYRLKRRVPEKKDGMTKYYELIRKEERMLLYVRIAIFCVTFGVIIYGIAYLVNDSNFPHNNPTVEMLKMVKYIFPFVCIVFILMIGFLWLEVFSAKRQMPAVKEIVKGEKEKEQKEPHGKMQKIVFRVQRKICSIVSTNVYTEILRATLGVVAITFIILGIVNGGMDTVFQKAIAICTECIGLG